MPRTDADDPWEYIFPSRCYALAGRQLHLSVRRSLHAASALADVGHVALPTQLPKGARNAPEGCWTRFPVAQAASDVLAWLRRAAAARDRVRLAYA
jgi:hypothetical protein